MVIKFIGVLALFAMTGCMSLKEQVQQQEKLVSAGDYASAYENASAAAGKAGPSGADINYWNAEAGTLALWCKDLPGAVNYLDEADNGFNHEARRLIGAGAAAQAAAIATNDCVLNYAPEGLDRVFVNLYKALAYGGSNDPRAMRVELNRVRQRQNEWFYLCTKDIAKQESQLSSMSATERTIAQKTLKGAEKVSVAMLEKEAASAVSSEQPAAVRFFARLQGFGNAYASHVTGVTRWCAGDASRNDLAQAAALAPSNRFVAEDASRAGSSSPKNRVWVYVEDGLAPRRHEKSMILPYPSIAGRANAISTITFSVPRLEERAAAASGYTVNGTRLEVLADIDALAKDQFNRAWTGILVRQIARTVSRVIAQEATQAALRKQDPAVSFVAGLALAAYDISMNAADLRCADLLPKKVWMGALERPANGKLTVTPQGQKAITVTLKSSGNALLWVRKPSRQAPATVVEIDLDKH